MLSPEFRAQMARVLSGFDMALGLLTDQDSLTAELKHLEEQHNALNIPNEYFPVSDRYAELRRTYVAQPAAAVLAPCDYKTCL